MGVCRGVWSSSSAVLRPKYLVVFIGSSCVSRLFTGNVNSADKWQRKQPSWFMLMKELASSYAGWEPPFIHHMVKPRLNSRHFRNLTTTPKLLANHNRSTWLRFSDYPPERELSFVSSLPPVFSHSFTETHLRKRATETGKSTQVSEDGGFFFFFF